MRKKKDVIETFHEINDRVYKLMKAGDEEKMMGKMVMLHAKASDESDSRAQVEALLETSLMTMYIEDEI